MREYDTDTWKGSRPWKNAFFQCKQEEAFRLKQLSSKIRNQRQDLEDRKRDKKVKFTDREPPTKKQRMNGSWGQSTAPKTLFQKTKTDSSRIQKTLYTRKTPPPRKPRPVSAFAASASNYSTSSGTTMGYAGSSSVHGSTTSGANISGSSSRSISSALQVGAASRGPQIWDSAPPRATTTTIGIPPASTTATTPSSTPTTIPTPATTGVTVRTVVRRPAPGPSAVPQHTPKSKTSPTRPQVGRSSSGGLALGDSSFSRGVPRSLTKKGSSSPSANGTSSPGTSGSSANGPTANSLTRPSAPPKKTAMSSMFLPSKRAAVKS